MSMSIPTPGVPEYVKPSLVVDWDIYTDEALRRDPHLTYKAFHETAPEIFYTPRNGGHWVISRFDLMNDVLRDSQHFSTREMVIPKANSQYVLIPLNLDPPDHGVYRIVLMRYLSNKAVAAMEQRLVFWANRLIDRVIDDGRCDFIETLGASFPVSVFLEMMGMPLERFEEFRAIVLEYFSNATVERRNELQTQIATTVAEMIEEKRRQPGDDLLSKLIAETVRGQPLTSSELQSICFLLFLAGLDTVANALTFSFRHLAADPELQDRLAAAPERVPDFVEESLRRYGVVNTPRIVKKDIKIGDADFREGDMVLCPLPLAGLDERKNPTPEQFDIDRKGREHMVFSSGPHICVGNILARAEMRVFTQEWLKRIPQFRIAQGAQLNWRPGLVLALMNLPLEWSPEH
jgi:cytochrome P450